MSEWRKLTDEMPAEYHAVLTQHVDDLYPVVAYRMGDTWLREMEGPEDSWFPEGRHAPLYRAPTHWRENPEPPRTEP